MTYYALILDGNGNCIGSHTYDDQPASLPTDEIACTAAQAATASQWIVQSGTVVPAPNTLADQAGAMLAAGLQIVCTSNSALSGTYACDPTTLSRAGNLLAAIAAAVPLPSPTIAWADINGNPHAFSVTEFKNLCAAMLAFELQLVPLANGAPGTLPTLPVTIA